MDVRKIEGMMLFGGTYEALNVGEGLAVPLYLKGIPIEIYDGRHCLHLRHIVNTQEGAEVSGFVMSCRTTKCIRLTATVIGSLNATAKSALQKVFRPEGRSFVFVSLVRVERCFAYLALGINPMRFRSAVRPSATRRHCDTTCF
jgi:hypothetical protein